MNFSQMLPMVKAMGGGGGDGFQQASYFVGGAMAVNEVICLSETLPDIKGGAEGFIIVSTKGVPDVNVELKFLYDLKAEADSDEFLWVGAYTSGVSAFTEFVMIDETLAPLTGMPVGFYMVNDSPSEEAGQSFWVHFFWNNP